ncbi:cofilin [Acrasis kona]|uniref:Cofilin n=1 Tax=Acrasis kona TaxID=1008807 RepID=A0AAW2Z869_9EUKA
MSATGIAVDDECVKVFNAMKKEHAYPFLLFGFNDKLNQIVILQKGEAGQTFGDFVSALPKNDVRYGVVDFHYSSDDGERQKLIFVNWAPDSAPIKKKMVAAGSKVSLKDKLVGLSFEIQATDLSEVDEKVIMDKCITLSK